MGVNKRQTEHQFSLCIILIILHLIHLIRFEKIQEHPDTSTYYDDWFKLIWREIIISGALRNKEIEKLLFSGFIAHQTTFSTQRFTKFTTKRAQLSSNREVIMFWVYKGCPRVVKQGL